MIKLACVLCYAACPRAYHLWLLEAGICKAFQVVSASLARESAVWPRDPCQTESEITKQHKFVPESAGVIASEYGP